MIVAKHMTTDNTGHERWSRPQTLISRYIFSTNKLFLHPKNYYADILEIMNVSRGKCLYAFVKFNIWDVTVKEYSSAFITSKTKHHQFKNKLEDKDERSLVFHEKNKILNSLLASEISPFINKTSISLLKPFIVFKRNCQTQYSFVVDNEVAKDMVERILPQLKQERSFVVEANPGLGLITLNLIKAEVPKIHIYESSKLKNITLQQLIDQYPHLLQVENYNIFATHKNQFVKVLENALNLDVNNKIIGVVQQAQFFSTFIHECVNCSLWNCLEVTDFYFVVTKNIWKNVMEETESRLRYITNCFFNLIFKTELLAEYPVSAFLPYSPHCREEKMFFVKVSKKSDFPGELSEQDVKLLLNFCKVLGRSKFNYIIQTLEQWIPECGPYLISKGISVTNQINDLSSDEFLTLYHFVKKLKGFKNFEIID